jgi:predicted RNase H-related nuclease YkuK (DUF458 family)
MTTLNNVTSIEELKTFVLSSDYLTSVVGVESNCTRDEFIKACASLKRELAIQYKMQDLFMEEWGITNKG